MVRVFEFDGNLYSGCMVSCDGYGEKLRAHSMSRGHTRFWITVVLQLRWGDPQSNAMVQALILQLIFLENCRWTNVETDIEIFGVPQA